MAISFNQIPGSVRVPFVYVEVDSSRAGVGVRRFRTLLIGQRLAAGSVEEDTPVQIAGAADAVAYFGRGSQLAHMAEAFRRQNPTGELWAVALDDASGGTAGTKTVTVTGTATAAGTIALYIAGRRVAVGIAKDDTATNAAAKVVTAITAAKDLPVTAASSAGVATLTARHKGVVDIDVRTGYYPDEALPAGLSVAVAAGTAGATDPGIADALTAIGDTPFDLIVTPYTTTADVTLLEAELNRRWGPLSQLDTVAIAAYKGATSGGTVAEATTYGNARNNPYLSVVDAHKSPTPTHEWAAAVGGAVAASAEIDPARPFQTLPLVGVLPAPVEDRATFTERNTLLYDGIATHAVDTGGTVRIERLVTTYQTNAAGIADAAYLDLNTALTLAYIKRDFRDTLLRKYPRHKLADDDARIGPGQAVITPRLGRAEAIARFRAWEEAGLVEGFDEFKAGLICERNAADRNRLDWLLPPDLVNQFRVGGVQIQFLL